MGCLSWNANGFLFREMLPTRVKDHLSRFPWQRLSAGAGSKGPRLYDWVRLPLSCAVPAGWEHWLVIRRSIPVGAEPPELAYVLVFARQGTTLQAMVQVIGARWTVEQCFEVGKGEVGLDEYEVRSWQGWYRHITLCMLAQAFLVALRAERSEEHTSELQSRVDLVCRLLLEKKKKKKKKKKK